MSCQEKKYIFLFDSQNYSTAKTISKIRKNIKFINFEKTCFLIIFLILANNEKRQKMKNDKK